VAAFRLARRTRLAAYRSGDGAWYLGLRDWNGDANRFNGVQPVAGPLRPRTGFHLDYLDAAGRPLDVPVVSPSDAASVVVKALAADSAAAAVERVVALRRAP
jgi:hypothetical protein